MDKNKAKDFAEKYSRLANILTKSKYVTRYDEAEDKEAWTLAHAFIDLDESFKEFSNNLLPKLLNEKLTSEEIHNILMDIGEEFCHILYHIRENKYYENYRERIEGGHSPNESK